MKRAFAFYDNRTGKRCGMASTATFEQALQELDSYRRRDIFGGRPDLHDLIPHLDIAELTPETWGSAPGDIIKVV